MEKLKMNLQLFADGGAAGGDGGAAAAAAGDTGVQAPDAGVRNNRRKRENPLANVQYGIQPGSTAQQVAPAQEAAQQGTDTEETFESLIKGKYKADADAWVQNIIRERLKNHQDNTAELEELRRLKTAVGRKFNADEQDVESLVRAVEYDEEALEVEASQRGMSMEALKTVKELEAQNAKLKQREQQSVAQQRMQQHYNALAQQAEALKAEYPGFNLMQEMQDPTFARLTAPSVGISVKQAYELVHMQEIQAMQAQQQAERMSKAIQANGARPMENGIQGGQGASTVKTDPRTLTRDDRKEIRRKVANGEQIVF